MSSDADVDYAEECLRIDKATKFKKSTLLLHPRKESCETQWENIKKKFLKWKDDSFKKK